MNYLARNFPGLALRLDVAWQEARDACPARLIDSGWTSAPRKVADPRPTEPGVVLDLAMIACPIGSPPRHAIQTVNAYPFLMGITPAEATELVAMFAARAGEFFDHVARETLDPQGKQP